MASTAPHTPDAHVFCWIVPAFGIYMHLAVTEQLERVGALPYLTVLHNIREMRAALHLPEPAKEAENVVQSEHDAQ